MVKISFPLVLQRSIRGNNHEWQNTKEKTRRECRGRRFELITWSGVIDRVVLLLEFRYGQYIRPISNLNGQYERKNNTDLWKACATDIGKYLKTKRLEWTGHVWRADVSLIRNELVKDLTRKSDRVKDPVNGG